MGRGQSVGTVPTRKALGAWYTPAPLVDLLVRRTLDPVWLAQRCANAERELVVVDPACGDGRLLEAVRTGVESFGHRCHLIGCDIDPAAVAAARRTLGPTATILAADGLTHDWAELGVEIDLVIGNPPFRSQMSAQTSRRGSSQHGGGPYADTAIEFLALSVCITEPGARIALVLPQSSLGSRDAEPVRSEVDRRCRRLWSWWSPRSEFDAAVLVCALGFERHQPAADDRHAANRSANWSALVAETLAIPRPDGLDSHGVLGDRATASANFRDEYYGLVPAVGDHGDGPPLITAGLIDPGICRWGQRPVRFAKQRYRAPRVALDRLSDRMYRWATDKLVPKVLVANQTRIIEAVVDRGGDWLPGVPVISVVARSGERPSLDEIAAVLTSPVASAVIWHTTAGTGLSASAVRIGPGSLQAVPWPTGSLEAAVNALRAGDVIACGAAVCTAYGLDLRHRLLTWWSPLAERAIEPRRSDTDP